MAWIVSTEPFIETVQYDGTIKSYEEVVEFIMRHVNVITNRLRDNTIFVDYNDCTISIYPKDYVVYDERDSKKIIIMSCLRYTRFIQAMYEEEQGLKKKEEENSMTNLFNGMFGKVAPGMCRISVNGDIAIKTGSGYKTYDVKTGTLTNCDNFVFDMGEEMFFIIPTNKVHIGDIILAGGKPRCVTGVSGNKIETLSFEDGQISTIVPEHHVFMGKQYFYGKIVSMFGNAVKGKGGMGSVMKYMMLSEMMKGKNGEGNNWMQMMPMMMLMNGNAGFDFNNMFDFGEDEDDEVEDTTTGEEEK